MNGLPQPPRWAMRLVRAALPDDHASDTVVGDLIEEFVERSRAGDPRGARRRFVRQAFAVAVYAVRDRVWDRLGDIANGQGFKGGGTVIRIVADLKIALRSLRRSPGFSVVATLMLAIGIGANTAIFSAVNGVLLEPLGFPEPDRLVSVRHTVPGFGIDEIGVAPDTYLMIKDDNQVFSEIGALRAGRTVNLTGDREPRVLEATELSMEIPSLLGLGLPLGRSFTAEEDAPGGPDVVVMSHALWRGEYGSDPSIVGRTIQIDGTPTQVIGVLPERVDLPNLDVDLWLPLRIDPNDPAIGEFGTEAIARLAPGRTAETAEANLASLVDRMAETYAEAENYLAFIRNGQFGTLVDPLKEQVVGDLQRPLWILLGTVAFVLLIACANVANLVMVRSEARQKEIAVRAALGADRRTVMRYFVAESAVLALTGGALGLLLAYLGLPALLAFTPESLPRADGVGIDGSVLLFTSSLVLLSIFLFGVMPAARAFTPGMFGSLKHARGSTAGRERHRLRNALVAGQTAMALMLLIGSGLLLRSFSELRRIDPGFEAEGVLTFALTLPESTYPTARSAADFHQAMVGRFRELPGVLSAGAANALPLSGGASGTPHRAEDVPVPPGELAPVTFYKGVVPGYFETMETQVVAGRAPERADHEQGLLNVVLNELAAERFWPGQDPLGRRVGPTSGDSVSNWYTVVGVVETVMDLALTEEPVELVYYPMVDPDGDAVVDVQTMSYVIRTAGDPTALISAVRRAVREVDGDLPIADIREMDAIVAESTARMSFTMIALGSAAAVALLLGAIGLYGVLSYVVAQRTREIGVRIALGAEEGAVRSMVVRQGMVVAGAGLLVGMVGALALTRVLESLLFGTSANDPLTFVSTSLVLLGVGALASYVPARRASSIDPMEALRAE